MKIIRTECWSLEMKLSEPYSIAYETFDHCTNIFLRCITDSGLTGMGCAAPAREVTGETPESVRENFQRVIEPKLHGMEPFRFALILEELKEELNHSPSARAMVDMMLFDLVSRHAGVPLYKYLGAYRESMETSITIGILPVAQTLEKARQFIDKGFSILKIKGGMDVEEDIEKIRKIRETFGAAVRLRFDANQGYHPDQAIYFVEQTKRAGVEVLEQPTPVKDLESLGRVCRQVPIPVMADESLMNLADAFHLTSNNLSDMINIKLMKVGGIYESMHINSVAKSAGVEAMVGCMDESGLSISAGLQFALSRPNIIYADLDGHLDLVGAPAAKAVILKEGKLYPRQEPGLGYIF
jgi:L-alanine-DL-glutamate epimerase-like enolase superfamily enzyme